MKKIIICLVVIIFLAQLSSAEAPTSSLEEVREIKLQKQESDPLFNKIGDCESHNNPIARNPYSSAKGRFQFLDSTWRYYAPLLWGESWNEKSVYSYEDNTDLAWFIYTTYGTKDWEADPISYNCWKSEIKNALFVK